MAETAHVKAPPYLPLKTLLGALDALREGVPKRIDRAIWRSQSGAVQGQIMIALRFLGLLDDSDVPNLPLLDNLAKGDDARRKELLRPIIETHYRLIIAHDLTKMTPAMLNEEIEKFGVSGSTLRKASTFFLQAAKYLDLPMSPFLKDKTRTSPRAKRAPRARVAVPASGNGTHVSTDAPPGGSSKSVTLHGGGTLTMIVTADVWSMPAEDRKFVLEIIDKIQGYEKPASSARPREKAAGQP